jgi:hypothetical protein
LDLDYIFARNAFPEQMGLKEPEQEEALSAPANARHDFHEAIALGLDEPVKI